MAVKSNKRNLSVGVSGLIILAFIFMLGSSSTLFAETYTLEQCVKLAKENRAAVERARGVERSDGAEVRRQFGRMFLPSVDAFYSESESKSREREQTKLDTISVFPDEDFKSSSMSLSAGITVFDGLSNLHDYLGVRKQHAGSEYGVIRAEQDIELEVKTAYSAYLANIRNLAVQEEAVKRSQEQLNLAQSRYDVGSASLSDVLKQKVQFGNDNLALLDAQNGAVNSRANLAFSVGLDPAAEDNFDTTYQESEFTGTLAEAINLGMNNHPGLRAADLNVSTMNHYLKSSYGAYLPSVRFNITRTWSESSVPDFSGITTDRSETNTRFGVNVNWSIFNQFQRERTVTGRKVARNNAKADYLELRNRIGRDVRTNFLNVEKARKQVEVSAETVASASEDMNLAQEKYNLGSASILDLLDAQVSLKDAQVSLIRAKLDLNLAIAQLENAMGTTK